MPLPIKQDLGTIDIGAGGSTTPLNVKFQHGWSIAPTVVGTAGTAQYTVRVSQDNVTYFDYKTLATLVDIVDAVEDKQFNWSWLKVTVVSGGGSTGTAQFGLEMKNA